MKKLLFIVLTALTFIACEDVIDVETPASNPKLSIDALIRVQDSSDPTTVQVTATLTSSFFDPVTPANLDEITITNLDIPNGNAERTIFLLEQQQGSGVFETTVTNDFLKDGRLELNVSYQGEVYTATTEFVPTVPFENLEQGDGTLFSGDETEVIVSYNDNPSRDDYYLFDFDFNEFLVSEDEFYQGQLFEFSYFYDDEITSGQVVEISIIGIDFEFFNYMNQLIIQAGGNQGPFQTPAATVRGNIINTTTPENFPLGYFAVVQEFKQSLVIE
jgi:hypothetical protein